MAKIVLIEDDEELAKTIKSYLELESHRVTLFHDGTEGLEFLQANGFTNVIVHPGGEASFAIALHCIRRERADWRMRAHFTAAHDSSGFETIHDGQNRNHRGHADRHTENREQCDETEETRILLGLQIAQPDPSGPRTPPKMLDWADVHLKPTEATQ